MALEGTPATKWDRFTWSLASTIYRTLWAASGALAYWSGFKVVVAMLNGIRAWWHYQEVEQISAWWFAGLTGGAFVCWYCHFVLEERSRKDYQKRWVEKQAEALEAAKAQAAIPMPKWVKAYLVIMGIVLLSVAAQSFFGEQ
jgi:hypothetical protein